MLQTVGKTDTQTSKQTDRDLNVPFLAQTRNTTVVAEKQLQ